MKPNTYIIDIDGTIFKHMTELESMVYGLPDLLPGVHEKMLQWSNEGAVIILLTARPEEYRYETEDQLSQHGIPYDQLVMGASSGKRYLINDTKPVGYHGRVEPEVSAYAIPVERDSGFKEIEI